MISAASFERAEDELAGGRYGAAWESYCGILAERVPRLRSADAFTVADVAVMERLAELSVLVGNLRAASNLLTSVQAVFQQAGNSYAAAFAAVKLASVETAAGNMARAETLINGLGPHVPPLAELEPSTLGKWEQACRWPDTRAEDRQVLLVRLYLEIGRLAAAKGQYRLTIALLERGVALCGPGAPPLAVDASSALLLALAGARLERGDLAGADEALNRFTGLAQPLIEVRWRTINAKLSLLRGSLGTARLHLERALGLCEQAGFTDGAAAAMLNLAQVLVYLNQTAEAERWIARAADTAVRLENPALADRATAALRLARARGRSMADSVAIAPSVTEMWLGASASAAEIADEMPDEANSSSESLLDLFEQRAITFHWLLGRRDRSAAGRFLDRMQPVFAGTDSMLLEARMLFLEGLRRYYCGDYENAAAALGEAASAAAELGWHLDLWQTQRVLSWTMGRLGKRQQAAEWRTRSDQMLAAITESLDPSSKAIFRLNKWTAEEEALAAQIDALLTLQAATATAGALRVFGARWKLWRSAVALMYRIDEYRAFNARGVAEHHAAPRTTAQAWWKVALRLGADRAILRFVVLPDRIVTLAMSRGRVRAGVSAVSRIAIRRKVAEYHESLVESATQAAARGTLEDISRMLQLDRLAAVLPARTRHLTVLADDSLHGVPFAALPCADQALSDRFVLSLGFEFSVRRPGRDTAKRAFLLALPYGTQSLPPLEGALAEAGIFDRWRRSLNLELQTGDAADGAAVLCHQMSLASYVHIACHGAFLPDEPAQSGFVLTSPAGRSGMLTIRDLARADLSSVRQAVLTSCWAADSFVLPGRFVISVPETLWRSGVSSVLGCLWEVTDEVASPFIRVFYENLLTMPGDRALREAQRKCCASLLPECAIEDTSDPYFWAGFQIYGET